MNNIIVSIICNTYNHEKYIKDALDGFIMQKTSFSFEVLIHDDASTDNTANIIREYEKKYPDIIKPIYETENQYSKKKGLVNKIQYSRVKGKYIAICEGDDYWIDPYKLQKQYDALENHSDVDICATSAIMVDAESKKEICEISPKSHNTIISIEDVILGGGGFVATASLMYRSSLNENIPNFRNYLNIDYTLQIHGALRGGMLYLSDNTLSYRLMSEGSWTSRNKDATLKRNFYHKILKMFRMLDNYTNMHYNSAINKAILKTEYKILYIDSNYKKLKQEKYKNFYDELTYKQKINLKLKYWFPILIKIKRYIKWMKT